jgi:hypothetical protein
MPTASLVLSWLGTCARHLRKPPMSACPARPKLSVPKHWKRSIQAALVHIISLAHYALVSTRSWAANSSTAPLPAAKSCFISRQGPGKRVQARR